jgi:glycine betaine catabolism A
MDAAQETTTVRELPRSFPVGPPVETFISPEWHRRDLDKLFRQTWHLAGHLSEIPEQGSFLLFKLCDAQIVVVRYGDDVRAYHNVCRHRGHRLCTADRGRLPSKLGFVCPYHGWSFSVDNGACLATVRMPKEFDKASIPLYPAHAEVWNGFIFVSFSEAPVPLEQLTTGIGLNGYDGRRLKIGAKIETTVAANWKVVIENNSECYHCTMNHPELIRRSDPWRTGPQQEWGKEFLDDPAKPATFSWDTFGFGTAFWGNVDPECKVPLPRTPDAPPEAWRIGCNPNALLIFMPYYALGVNFKPSGPEETIVTKFWFVHEDAVEGHDYTAESVSNFFDTVFSEDAVLCTEVQRGLRGGRYEPGPLNPVYQGGGIAMHTWYMRRVGLL